LWYRRRLCNRRTRKLFYAKAVPLSLLFDAFAFFLLGIVNIFQRGALFLFRDRAGGLKLLSTSSSAAC
jgi:hypothetical protein